MQGQQRHTDLQEGHGTLNSPLSSGVRPCSVRAGPALAPRSSSVCKRAPRRLRCFQRHHRVKHLLQRKTFRDCLDHLAFTLMLSCRAHCRHREEKASKCSTDAQQLPVEAMVAGQLEQR